MTQQENYNIVRKHLLTQNAKSQVKHVDYGGATRLICAYRGEEGRKCAIGILISDERYTPTLEGNRVTSQAVWDAAELGPTTTQVNGRTLSTALFYEHLQEIHDLYAVETWREHLDNFARQHKLEVQGDETPTNP